MSEVVLVGQTIVLCRLSFARQDRPQTAMVYPTYRWRCGNSTRQMKAGGSQDCLPHYSGRLFADVGQDAILRGGCQPPLSLYPARLDN
jgi:hypothetical protein